MTDIYLHFRCTYYGLYGNAPVHTGEMQSLTSSSGPVPCLQEEKPIYIPHEDSNQWNDAQSFFKNGGGDGGICLGFGGNDTSPIPMRH